MRLVWGYFGVATALTVVFSLLFARLAAGQGVRTSSIVIAAGLAALVWPLTLPLVAFASVAATELIRAAIRKKAVPAAGRAAVMSPLGAKV